MLCPCFSKIFGLTDTRQTIDELFSYLPPVTVGLFQENKPFALPDADLPSISATVVVVILGLEDHCTTRDTTHCHAPGAHHRCCRRLLMPHRTPPSPRQHLSPQSCSANFPGSVRMVDTGHTGWVSTGQVRLEPGQCHVLKRRNKCTERCREREEEGDY